MKIDISVRVSWTTPRGGKVEGVRHTTLAIRPKDVSDTSYVSDVLLVAGADAQASFREMLTIYEDDHRENVP